MNYYETREFFDLKPPVQINDKFEKYKKEIDELHKKYEHDINCYKGYPIAQLTLSGYRIEEEIRIMDKYFQ